MSGRREGTGRGDRSLEEGQLYLKNVTVNVCITCVGAGECECVYECVCTHMGGSEGEPCVWGTLPFTVALVTFMAKAKLHLPCFAKEPGQSPPPLLIVNGKDS